MSGIAVVQFRAHRPTIASVRPAAPLPEPAGSRRSIRAATPSTISVSTSISVDIAAISGRSGAFSDAKMYTGHGH
jgi:hypothetical protein